ncbi:MAG: hypothetical protein AAGA46_02140 [Cyanobacteria bacterium P01_F01_bin.13]
MAKYLGHDSPLGAFRNLGSWVQRRSLGVASLSILDLTAFYPQGFPAVPPESSAIESQTSDSDTVARQIDTSAPAGDTQKPNTHEKSTSSSVEQTVPFRTSLQRYFMPGETTASSDVESVNTVLPQKDTVNTPAWSNQTASQPDSFNSNTSSFQTTAAETSDSTAEPLAINTSDVTETTVFPQRDSATNSTSTNSAPTNQAIPEVDSTNQPIPDIQSAAISVSDSAAETSIVPTGTKLPDVKELSKRNNLQHSTNLEIHNQASSSSQSSITNTTNSIQNSQSLPNIPTSDSKGAIDVANSQTTSPSVHPPAEVPPATTAQQRLTTVDINQSIQSLRAPTSSIQRTSKPQTNNVEQPPYLENQSITDATSTVQPLNGPPAPQPSVPSSKQNLSATSASGQEQLGQQQLDLDDGETSINQSKKSIPQTSSVQRIIAQNDANSALEQPFDTDNYELATAENDSVTSTSPLSKVSSSAQQVDELSQPITTHNQSAISSKHQTASNISQPNPTTVKPGDVQRQPNSFSKEPIDIGKSTNSQTTPAQADDTNYSTDRSLEVVNLPQSESTTFDQTVSDKSSKDRVASQPLYPEETLSSQYLARNEDSRNDDSGGDDDVDTPAISESITLKPSLSPQTVSDSLEIDSAAQSDDDWPLMTSADSVQRATREFPPTISSPHELDIADSPQNLNAPKPAPSNQKSYGTQPISGETVRRAVEQSLDSTESESSVELSASELSLSVQRATDQSSSISAQLPDADPLSADPLSADPLSADPLSTEAQLPPSQPSGSEASISEAIKVPTPVQPVSDISVPDASVSSLVEPVQRAASQQFTAGNDNLHHTITSQQTPDNISKTQNSDPGNNLHSDSASVDSTSPTLATNNSHHATATRQSSNNPSEIQTSEHGNKKESVSRFVDLTQTASSISSDPGSSESPQVPMGDSNNSESLLDGRQGPNSSIQRSSEDSTLLHPTDSLAQSIQPGTESLVAEHLLSSSTDTPSADPAIQLIQSDTESVSQSPTVQRATDLDNVSADIPTEDISGEEAIRYLRPQIPNNEGFDSSSPEDLGTSSMPDRENTDTSVGPEYSLLSSLDRSSDDSSVQPTQLDTESVSQPSTIQRAADLDNASTEVSSNDSSGQEAIRHPRPQPPNTVGFESYPSQDSDINPVEVSIPGNPLQPQPDLSQLTNVVKPQIEPQAEPTANVENNQNTTVSYSNKQLSLARDESDSSVQSIRSDAESVNQPPTVQRAASLDDTLTDTPTEEISSEEATRYPHPQPSNSEDFDSWSPEDLGTSSVPDWENLDTSVGSEYPLSSSSDRSSADSSVQPTQLDTESVNQPSTIQRAANLDNVLAEVSSNDNSGQEATRYPHPQTPNNGGVESYPFQDSDINPVEVSIPGNPLQPQPDLSQLTNVVKPQIEPQAEPTANVENNQNTTVSYSNKQLSLARDKSGSSVQSIQSDTESVNQPPTVQRATNLDDASIDASSTNSSTSEQPLLSASDNPSVAPAIQPIQPNTESVSQSSPLQRTPNLVDAPAEVSSGNLSTSGLSPLAAKNSTSPVSSVQSIQPTYESVSQLSTVQSDTSPVDASTDSLQGNSSASVSPSSFLSNSTSTESAAVSEIDVSPQHVQRNDVAAQLQAADASMSSVQDASPAPVVISSASDPQKTNDIETSALSRQTASLHRGNLPKLQTSAQTNTIQPLITEAAGQVPSENILDKVQTQQADIGVFHQDRHGDSANSPELMQVPKDQPSELSKELSSGAVAKVQRSDQVAPDRLNVNDAFQAELGTTQRLVDISDVNNQSDVTDSRDDLSFKLLTYGISDTLQHDLTEFKQAQTESLADQQLDGIRAASEDKSVELSETVQRQSSSHSTIDTQSLSIGPGQVESPLERPLSDVDEINKVQSFEYQKSLEKVSPVSETSLQRQSDQDSQSELSTSVGVALSRKGLGASGSSQLPRVLKPLGVLKPLPSLQTKPVRTDKAMRSHPLLRSDNKPPVQNPSNPATISSVSNPSQSQANSVQRQDIPSQWSNLEDLVTHLQDTTPNHGATKPSTSYSPTNDPATAKTTSPQQHSPTIKLAKPAKVTVQRQTTSPASATKPTIIQACKDTSTASDATSTDQKTDDNHDYSQYLELLAQEVYSLLRQRLSLEQERRGPKYPR